MIVRGQLVRLADGMGNVRTLTGCDGQQSLVKGEDAHGIEIEVACFQHPHDLKTLERLARKGDLLYLYNLTKQFLKSFQIELRARLVEHFVESRQVTVKMKSVFSIKNLPILKNGAELFDNLGQVGGHH